MAFEIFYKIFFVIVVSLAHKVSSENKGKLQRRNRSADDLFKKNPLI